MPGNAVPRLKSLLGPQGYSEDPAEIAPHLTEWRGKYRGQSTLLLKPASTAEVSSILRICNDTGTPVVPQGGNTGLVGGQLPHHGEILLSLERMRAIRHLDTAGTWLAVEAGVKLAEAQETARQTGLMLPLSMASEGSCTIGGAISTNAGGINVLRYGMARDQVLGLEVVLADGTVLDLMRSLRKDNTGYDLKQLFVGAEGTLGVVTAAALRLHPRPDHVATAFLAVPDADAALKILSRLQGTTGGLVNACELVPRFALELVLAHMSGTTDPFDAPAPWYLLCEASGAGSVQAPFEEALAATLEDGWALDAVIAASSAQRAALWRLRESISEAEKLEAPSFKHDIAVPVAAQGAFIAAGIAAVQRIAPDLRPVVFGHLGDGNLHFNFMLPRTGDTAALLARWDEIADAVYAVVKDFSGTISAEHGIGVMKRSALAALRAPAEIALMRTLKATLDPKNILNPGKLVP